MSIILQSLALGGMNNLIHIISDQDSGKAMIIDAAWDADAISSVLTQNQWQLEGILLTHTHGDHTSAVNAFLQGTDLPVYVSREEYSLGLFVLENPSYIAHGDVLYLGESKIEVISTPGHTTGSVCFLADDILITGDTLFIDACGRCNYPESDVDKMWYSLQKLKQLPNNTVIYCGHDYGQKQTDTIGNQKLTNPYLLIDNKEFFVDFRMNLQSQYRQIPFPPSSIEEMRAIEKKYH